MDVAELDPHHLIGRAGLSSMLCRRTVSPCWTVTSGSPAANHSRRTTARSTLLGGLRAQATWENADPHSGERKIHGKDVLHRSEAWPNAART
jgi:hypothetical protein